MPRFLRLLSIPVLAFTTLSCSRDVAPPASTAAPVNVVEASIADLRKAMEEGRTTSTALVQQYLMRIALYEDRFNATLHVNPEALKEAAERDRERASGKIRGPLHGIPIALKDNIQTTDMPTTGGAVAFEGLMPPYDATLTRNLRDAGAIIIAKTNLTELANWVAGAPTPMPGNYTGLGGYGLNPYDPRRDPREQTGDGRPVLNTGGSSSGAGTAANFWAANVGTETSGSILSPANQNVLAAIKPTVGRVSRYGVIPITADQDTAGPMAKYVADVALLLGVLESGSPDPNDSSTSRCTPPPNRDYTPHLKADGLKGARIGIPRAFYYAPITPPGATEPRGGLNPEQLKVMNAAIEMLTQQGATIVDPADIPSVVDTNPKTNFLLWNTCSGADNARGKDDELLDRVQVRHEARLQRVAGVAWQGRAVGHAERPARVQHRAHQPRHDQVRPVATRHLGRDGSAARQGPLRGRSCARPAGLRGPRHRRGDEGTDARRAALPGRQRRCHRRQARLPHRHRAVRHRRECADAGLPIGIRSEARSVRRQLHRHGMRRASIDRAGVRLRAGDAAACATAGGTVARFRGSEVPGFRGS